jgi:phytanoyl-CoA hydroxylase
MLLDSAQLARFHRDGFLRGPQVVDAEGLTALRQELARVINDKGKPGVPQPMGINNLAGDQTHPVWQVVNIWEASEPYWKLLNIPGLGATIQKLIGGNEIRLWHDQIQYKPEGIGGVNAWHQDWPYWPTMSVPNAVTAWIAIDDADAANGCMSMVPGSNHWGNAINHLHSIQNFSVMPPQYQGHATVAQLCPVRAGEVHFHHSLTWHGSHANTSTRPRRAIALHFMNETVLKTPGETHCCSRYHEGAEGEPLRGERFPLIWKDGQAVTVETPKWLVAAATP